MSKEFCADSNHSAQASSRLAAGYDELTRVDQALRDAERRLADAHSLCTQQPDGHHAQMLYLEVLALRDRARRVLVELAEIWISDR